jgi:alcohol dehydrogenase class IV
MDALTHAIEGYTATWRTPFTDGPGLAAIRLIFDNLKKAVDNGKDEEARKNMMYAACQAGTCFGNGMAGLAHSCGHALGGIFHTPHGVAMGLYLPYTMEYVANGSEETLQRYAEIARFCGIAQGSDKECCKALIAAVRKLVKDIGQSPTVKDLKIDRAKYEKAMSGLVDRAVNEAMTIAVTRVPESEDLEKMFLCAYDGKPVDF